MGSVPFTPGLQRKICAGEVYVGSPEPHRGAFLEAPGPLGAYVPHRGSPEMVSSLRA